MDFEFGRSVDIRDNIMESISQKTSDIIGENTVTPFREYFVDVFTRVMEPNVPYEHNWHIDYLCDRMEYHIMRLIKGEKRERHLLINVPPRTLKSKIVSVALNSWVWSIAPRIRFLSGSHSETLALEHSAETRKLVKDRYHAGKYGRGYRLLSDQDAKGYFVNSEGGARNIFSVGSAPIGKGGDVITFDDPIKPPTEKDLGYITTNINAANIFYDKDLSTRLNDPSRSIFIVVMQRLKTDDLSGHILETYGENDYEWICIPAEAVNPERIKPKELIKFYTNGLFFEGRFDEKVLAARKKSLQSEYSGQMNQDPTSIGRDGWCEDMFIIVGDEEADKVKQHSRITCWDLATSKKQINSATAYVEGGSYKDGALITGTDYFWKEFPDIIAEIKSRRTTHWIENKSSGQDALPLLKRLGIPAHEWVNKNIDKIRMVNFTIGRSIIMEKRLYITSSAMQKLFYDKVQGIDKFPMSSKDDVSDALCIFINVMNERVTPDALLSSITANANLVKPSRKREGLMQTTERKSSWNF